METFPLLYNGYFIRTFKHFTKVENLQTGLSFNVKFKTWAICKRFIDNLK